MATTVQLMIDCADPQAPAQLRSGGFAKMEDLMAGWS